MPKKKTKKRSPRAANNMAIDAGHSLIDIGATFVVFGIVAKGIASLARRGG